MAEDRGGRFWQGQQFFQRLPARFKGEITARNVVRIDDSPGTAQRLNVALQAVMTQRHLFWSGDTADTLMPQFLKIVHGVECGGEVIDMNGWQLQLRREFVRHDHRR